MIAELKSPLPACLSPGVSNYRVLFSPFPFSTSLLSAHRPPPHTHTLSTYFVCQAPCQDYGNAINKEVVSPDPVGVSVHQEKASGP